MKRTYILKPLPPVQGPLSPAEEHRWLRLFELQRDRSPWGRAEQQLLVSSLSPVLASRISEYQFRRVAQARAEHQRFLRRQAEQQAQQQHDTHVALACLLVCLGMFLAVFLSR